MALSIGHGTAFGIPGPKVGQLLPEMTSRAQASTLPSRRALPRSLALRFSAENLFSASSAAVTDAPVAGKVVGPERAGVPDVTAYLHLTPAAATNVAFSDTFNCDAGQKLIIVLASQDKQYIGFDHRVCP
jgi:hypothetical protein